MLFLNTNLVQSLRRRIWPNEWSDRAPSPRWASVAHAPSSASLLRIVSQPLRFAVISSRGGKRVVRYPIAFCVSVLIVMPVALSALQPDCIEKVSAKIRVDQGHPWRPPFGVDRVGAPISVHVELTADKRRQREYDVAAYRQGREIERHQMAIMGDKSPFFGHERFKDLPEAIALFAHCASNGRTEEVARLAVRWPEIEAEA